MANETDDERCVYILVGHRFDLNEAAWSPDGRWILTTSGDGTAKVWPAWQTTDELIAYAKGCCAVRDLTPDERQLFGLK